MLVRIKLSASLWFNLKTILAAYVLLGLLYAFTPPVFEKPDELWHFAYIKLLADGRGFPTPPVVISDDTPAQEIAQPPLYYLMAAPIVQVFVPDTTDFFGLLHRNPSVGSSLDNNDNKNMFIHTDREAFPFQGTVLAIYILRVFSLLFGGLTIWFTYQLCLEVWPQRSSTALLAAAIVAFTPEFVFVTSAVSNDGLSAAMGALVLWLTARVLRRGLTRRRVLILGSALGLAALSKASALGLIPIVVFVVLMAAPASDGQSLRWRDRISGSMWIVLPMLLIAGAWYVRTYVLYGDLLGTAIHELLPWARPQSISFGEALLQMPTIIRSYWLAYGWGTIGPPQVFYSALNLFAAIGLIGALYTLYTVIVNRDRIVMWCLLALGGWLGVIVIALIRWNQILLSPLGRLALPSIAAIGVLIAIGWTSIGSRVLIDRRWSFLQRIPWASAAPIGLFSLVLIALPIVLLPAYAPPQFLSVDQIAQQPGQATDVRFGNLTRLIRLEVPRDPAPQPGESVPLRLCWETLSSDARDLLVLIQFIGIENRVAATRRTVPGLGGYATVNWQAGRYFCDDVDVLISSTASAPAVYKVEVSLIDFATQERMIAYAPNGSELSTDFVGAIKIAPQVYASPTIDHPLNIRLGDQVDLIGYAIEPITLDRGGVVHLRLYWRAVRPPDADYTVFVHLNDASGQTPAQADAPPQSGAYPTSFWAAGEVVIDDRDIVLPQTVSAGRYVLGVGLYNPIDGSRLAVAGNASNQIDLPDQLEVK